MSVRWRQHSGKHSGTSTSGPSFAELHPRQFADDSCRQWPAMFRIVARWRPDISMLAGMAHNALLDSNGNVVECTRPNLIEEGIKWKYNGGRTAPEGSRWLRANFKQMQIKYGEIAVYFWLGTCDMTRKLGEFIRLRKDYLDYAALLLIKLEKLIKFANRHNFALTFLEIPVYSIKEYNASKRHSNPDKFDEQDRKLKYAIQVVNEEIAKLNVSISTHSPKFSCDLLRNCHNKKAEAKIFPQFLPI